MTVPPPEPEPLAVSPVSTVYSSELTTVILRLVFNEAAATPSTAADPEKVTQSSVTAPCATSATVTTELPLVVVKGLVRVAVERRGVTSL